MKTEFVTLSVSDGASMKAYVAHPNGAPKAAMIVLQEAFGVNAHIKDLTERFAREGYLSIAPELFHRSGEGVDCGYTDFAAVMPHMQAMKDAGLEADLKAAYGWLSNNGSGLKTAAIGYCMGGRAAFLAGLTLPLACAISYYGGGIADSQFFPGLLGRVDELSSPVLLVWGGLDQHIGLDKTREVEDALRAAKKPYANVTFSYADHGFFCDARAQYNATAAAEAWALTLAFLKNHTAA
jgi:carboxymethylenebutenolidase